MCLITAALLLGGIAVLGTANANLGDKVLDGDSDHLPVISSLGDAENINDDPRVCRTPGSASNADYYIHWGACDEVDRDDIRLTDSAENAGTVVESGDEDRGNEISTEVAADVLSNVGFVEADGVHGIDDAGNDVVTEGDWVYFSTDNTLGVNDIRLSDTDGGSPGTLVQSGDTDLDDAADDDSEDFPRDRTLLRYGDTTLWGLRYYDTAADDRFDGDEDPALLVQHPGKNFSSTNDIALTGAGDPSFGDLLDTDDDLVPHYLIDVQDSVYLAVTDEVTTPWRNRHFFLHFQQFATETDDPAILEDDIIIQAERGNIGDRVTSEQNGQGERIDNLWALQDLIFFLDADDDGTYTPQEDPLYLHDPRGTRDSFEAGDIRLTDFEGETAGTVVRSEDDDLVAYGDYDPNMDPAGGTAEGTWYVMFDDGDRSNATALETLSNGRTIAPDGSWEEGIDGAYVAASSTVADGDRRLYTDHDMANTQLDCVDGQDGQGDYADQVEHQDCNRDWDEVDEVAALANVPHLNSTSSSVSFPGSSPVIYDANTDGQVSDGDELVYHPEIPPGTIDETDTTYDDILGDDLHRIDQLRSTNSTTIPAGNGTAETDDFVAGSDFVYYDNDNNMNITDGDVRIFVDWSAFDNGNPGTDSLATCEADGFDTVDPDCGTSLSSERNIRVTGTDSTYDRYSAAEYVYHSFDDTVNEGDFRFLDYNPDGHNQGGVLAGTVAKGDDDVTHLAADSDDNLYLSWCSEDLDPDCTSHPTKRVRIGDLQLADAHNRIDDSSTEYDVELSTVAVQKLKRYDRGTSITDDAFYLSFDDTDDRLAINDLRLVPFGDHDAGTMIQSGDDDRTSLSSIQEATGDFQDFIRWVDRDGDGYLEDDFVYVDLPEWAGTQDELTRGDIRLTEVTLSGTTYSAGTLVSTGDEDRASFDFVAPGAQAPTSAQGTEDDWTLYWHDTERSGDVDQGEQLYLNPGHATENVPSLLSIRLSGEAGAPSGGGGGGGSDDGGGGDDGTTAPVPPSITIEAPEEGATLQEGDELSITGTASPGDAALSTVEVTADGEDLDVSGVQEWSATWTSGEPGDVTVRATVTDADGEQATDSVTVTVEEGEPEGPTVTITSPSDGDHVQAGQTVTVEGTAEEGDATVTSVRLTADDRSLAVRGIADWTADWTPQGSGDVTLEVTARDRDGLTATDSVTVTIEGDAPSIQITQPEEDATVNVGETVTIEGTANAGTASLSTVTISVNGEELDVEGLDDWSTEWTPEEEGDHIIEATVTDEADLTGSDTVTVTASVDTPAPGALLLATVLALVAIGARRAR